MCWFIVTMTGVDAVVCGHKPKGLFVTKNERLANRMYSLMSAAYTKGCDDIRRKIL